MKNKFFLLLLLVIPLLSGCFHNNQANGPGSVFEPQTQFSEYKSQEYENFTFTAKYPQNWQLNQRSTGQYGEFNDFVKFNLDSEIIWVEIIKPEAKESYLEKYTILSEAQTEVNGILAHKIYGNVLTPEGYNFELVLIPNVDYLIVLRTNKPDSVNFVNFLTNFSFEKMYEPTDYTVDLTLFFGESSLSNEVCEINVEKSFKVNRPLEDLQLIPLVTRLLIQQSGPEDLANGSLVSNIPVTVELLSFGYNDNTAILNFNRELAKEASDCVKQGRREQIVKTVLALNEISDLQIERVEIQIEGEAGF